MGLNLGGIMKSLVNPMSLMQLAMGPAGWASLAMKAIGSQIAMSLIQQIGTKLGLPQPLIDMAQAGFAHASGQPGLAQQNISEAVRGIVSQMQLPPAEAGRLERELNGAADKSYEGLSGVADAFVKKFKAQSEEDEGGSWLVALAKAMGTMMDKKANQMVALSDKISAASSKETKTGSAEANTLMSDNAKLQAYGQELGILSTAFAQVAKSAGEALQTAARK
jgi:hypothetical protein